MQPLFTEAAEKHFWQNLQDDNTVTNEDDCIFINGMVHLKTELS